MALNKVLYIYFLLLFSVRAMPEIELPEISTKQAISNLRFISKDGKFTYYQRRSGSLLLSTNLKVKKLEQKS